MCHVAQGNWIYLLVQQLLVVLLSLYLTKPHLRIMPAFACKTHGPVTIRQHSKDGVKGRRVP